MGCTISQQITTQTNAERIQSLLDKQIALSDELQAVGKSSSNVVNIALNNVQDKIVQIIKILYRELEHEKITSSGKMKDASSLFNILKETKNQVKNILGIILDSKPLHEHEQEIFSLLVKVNAKMSSLKKYLLKRNPELQEQDDNNISFFPFKEKDQDKTPAPIPTMNK